SQLEVACFARLARRSLSWRTVGTGLEACVAQPVPATLGDQQALPGLDQIADDLLGSGVDHRGANRHWQDQVFALGPGAVGAATLGAILGIETTGVAVVHQGVEVIHSLDVYGTAVATVTAVGTALLDELFATKAHHAITTVTGFYRNRYFIDEFHERLPPWGGQLKQENQPGLDTPRIQKQKSPVAWTGLFQQCRA